MRSCGSPRVWNHRSLTHDERARSVSAVRAAATRPPPRTARPTKKSLDCMLISPRSPLVVCLSHQEVPPRSPPPKTTSPRGLFSGVGGVIIKIGRKEGRKERIFFGSWRAYSTSRSYLPHTSSTLHIPDTDTRACAYCACVRQRSACGCAIARCAVRARARACTPTAPARHSESRVQRISHG